MARTRLFGWLASAIACVSVHDAAAEIFVDVGVNSSRVETDIATQPKTESSSTGLHVGVGARRALSEGSIGVRLELDDIDSNLLLAVRALDYRHHLSDRFAIGGFLGAARLDLATPAYGYYLGGGIQIKDIMRGWDLGIDVRMGDKIARDNLLPTDPQGQLQNDSFYDLSGVSVYLSYRF